MLQQIDIMIACAGWTSALPDAKGIAWRAACAALPATRDRSGLCIMLSGNAAVRALNRDWRGKDRPTNVLSFPSGDRLQPHGLGDVILAFETVLQEAHRQGKPLRHHLSHLVVHGILHLLGDDHETARDALIMESRERQILARLGVADPYRVHAKPAAGI
jgi:probable rRNA maturation factor